MSRITMIHHVNVQIGNRERTREWYTKVLGAEFLDRGPVLNDRQLQLRLGSAEIHFTETPRPTTIPSSHLALEVNDWDAMLAHLQELGVPHARTFRGSTRPNVGGTDPYHGRREDTGEHYTYIHDPDGNMIELVYHPLGLEDSHGTNIAVVHDNQLRWTQIPGFVASAYGQGGARHQGGGTQG
jgi:catechol 2,3-dioxygenase-like lactoylglutathione lyase family enzyme